MSRPRFPIGCILPVGAIHRINQQQEEYDRDPGAYERRESEREEERQQEQFEEQSRREQEQEQEQPNDR